MGGILTKIMPARTQKQETVTLVADLDQLVQKPLGFRLGGKVYQIEVGTVRKLTQMSDRLSEIMQLLGDIQEGKPVPDKKLYSAYHRYLSVLCPEMTESVIQSMNQRQLKMLLKTIMQYATGQTATWNEQEPEDEKKKMSKAI